MKKIMFFAVAAIFVLGLATLAGAEPKALPAGTVISAEIIENAAFVTITGVTPVTIEFYAKDGVRRFAGKSPFSANLNDGNRFNFTFKDGDKEYYVLLDPEMKKVTPAFVGKGIELDDCKAGCAFVIK